LQATRRFSESDHQEERFDEAAELAAGLRELDPADPVLGMMEAQIAFYRGLAAGAKGDFELMEARCRESIASNPRQVMPYTWVASLEYGREEYGASFEHLRAAREVLTRHTTDDAVRALHPALLAKLHIWTFAAAGQQGTAEALELARDARADLEVLLDAGAEVEPVELLNWAEFLATTPAPDLRDCEEARSVLDRFELDEILAGTQHEGALRSVEAALRDCR
jgi:hypothetical protein